MRFSIRRSIYFDDFDKWLSGLGGVPIELALPYKLDDFLAGVELDALAAYIADMRIIVTTV